MAGVAKSTFGGTHQLVDSTGLAHLFWDGETPFAGDYPLCARKQIDYADKNSTKGLCRFCAEAHGREGRYLVQAPEHCHPAYKEAYAPSGKFSH